MKERKKKVDEFKAEAKDRTKKIIYEIYGKKSRWTIMKKREEKIII